METPQREDPKTIPLDRLFLLLSLSLNLGLLEVRERHRFVCVLAP